jgi:hypothetical protein
MQDFATIHISNQNHVYVAAVMLLVEKLNDDEEG